LLSSLRRVSVTTFVGNSAFCGWRRSMPTQSSLFQPCGTLGCVCSPRGMRVPGADDRSDRKISMLVGRPCPQRRPPAGGTEGLARQALSDSCISMNCRAPFTAAGVQTNSRMARLYAYCERKVPSGPNRPQRHNGGTNAMLQSTPPSQAGWLGKSLYESRP